MKTKTKAKPGGYNSLEYFDVNQQPVALPRKNFKQTVEMIQRIINSYFQVVQLESDMVACKQVMCQHFITKHPKLTNQPGDMGQAIVKGNSLQAKEILFCFVFVLRQGLTIFLAGMELDM
jgi:hypothetical protein